MDNAYGLLILLQLSLDRFTCFNTKKIKYGLFLLTLIILVHALHA